MKGALIKREVFDSKLFGYSVGRISGKHLQQQEMNNLIKNCALQGITLVYRNINPHDTLANSITVKAGGLLVDNKCTYIFQIQEEQTFDVTENIVSKLHKPIDDNLLSLALQSGYYSRFNQDKNFTHNEFARLYKSWMERSLAGIIADEVFVFSEENVDKGIITLQKNNNRGTIGLLAVDAGYRGKSIGEKLVHAGLSFFKQNGYNRIIVATQKRNVDACKFYEHIGFTLKKQENVYHFWL